MAYNRTYYFNFVSESNLKYRVELFDDVADSTYYDISGALGGAAANIKYGSDGAIMFAPFKPSTCTLEFMVRNRTDATYINQLRTARNERDVYITISREVVNGTNSPQYAPLWAGFLLIDLSDDPDEATPYPITLKFIDGLASLKYYDFVPSTTTQTADHLYTIANTFIPDSGNSGGMYASHRTFIDLISICLSYAGAADTTTGSAANPVIQTAIRWYNGVMPGTGSTPDNNDPLRYTRARPDTFYEVVNTDSGENLYRAKTCYDVLKSICKAWGMRVFYWKNKWQFVQINQYREEETGTQAAPVNITGFKYNMNGTAASTYALNGIGGFWSKYDLEVSNTQTSSKVKNLKLAGGQYGTLPAYKKVTVDFISVDNVNKFQLFPEFALYGGLPTTTGSACADTYGFQIFGPIKFDGVNDQDFYQRIVLDFWNGSGVAGEIELFWGLYAREAGTGSNTANTRPETNGWTHLCSISPQGSVNPTTWYDPDQFDSGNGVVGQFGDGTYANDQNYFSCWTRHPLPPGASTINILDPGQMAGGSIGNGIWDEFSYIHCPVSIFGNKEWEFAYYHRCNSFGSGPAVRQHGHCHSGFTDSNPFDSHVHYSNPPLGNGVQSSMFSPIVNGAVGNNSTITSSTIATSDTEVLEIKNIYFGDSGYINSLGALEVYNGSSWEITSLGGGWGIDTLTGSNTFSAQLTDDILNSQGGSVKTFTVQTTLNPSAKSGGVYYNDGTANKPQYAFPGTKFFTPSHTLSGTPEASWLMHTGTFFLSQDVWKWTLYEQKNFGVTKTSIIKGVAGDNTGIYGWKPEPVDTGGKLIAPAPIEGTIKSLGQNVGNLNYEKYQPLAIISTAQEVNINDIYSGYAVTSLAVREIETAIFKEGDVFYLQTQGKIFNVVPTTSGQTQEEYNAEYFKLFAPISFEVASDQAAGATSISVVSKTVYRDITPGDTISFDVVDLMRQYQNKTRGTIGGMPVTADALGPIEDKTGEYWITGASTTYLKILPRDFMINHDGSYEALEFKNSTNSGLQVGDAAQEMIATVDIPYNTKATSVAIWGSVTGKVVEIYLGGVDTNGIGSTIGSGTTNGAAIALSPVPTATATNYLIILVKVTATSNRIYGGKVVLTTIL